MLRKTVISLIVFTLFVFVNLASAITVKDISDEIMSPFCPGRLLTNCPSAGAARLRISIQQKIDRGSSKEQILDSIVKVYGLKALAAPPKKGFYWIVWVLPFIVILFGGAGITYLLITILIRRRKAPEDKCGKEVEQEIKRPYKTQLEKELEEFEF